MTKTSALILCLSFAVFAKAQTSILNKLNKEPVSFATVSFGNGNGVFADDEGKFIFTKKLYADIDSLYISALGFKELYIATDKLPDTLFMQPKASSLNEIVVTARGNFKKEKVKAAIHNDYYKCWLPTIESEIAVFFPNTRTKTTKVGSVLLPIKLEASDWSKRKRSSTKIKSFSTLFRMHFYENNNGFPGRVLTYDNIVFKITEASSNLFELDVSEHDIIIPKDGLFVSIQVLGYTDRYGKLLPNKKYKEVKTKRGIVKVSTTFRPLLPFTNKIPESRTFVKRVFLNDNQWIKFEKKNIENSNLLLTGLNNYGMGLGLQVFKN